MFSFNHAERGKRKGISIEPSWVKKGATVGYCDWQEVEMNERAEIEIDAQNVAARQTIRKSVVEADANSCRVRMRVRGAKTKMIPAEDNLIQREPFPKFEWNNTRSNETISITTPKQI